MAKKEEKVKVIVEREYTIPLRKEFQKAPRYKRAKKAINALRSFIIKHMKSDNVKIGKYLNNIIWERSIKNPPHKVKVKAVKYDNGKVEVEILNPPKEEKSRFLKYKNKEKVKDKEINKNNSADIKEDDKKKDNKDKENKQ